MSHTSAFAPVRRANAPAARRAARAKAQAVTAANEGLRPARGLLLGLGLSSLIWSALVALVVF